MVQDTIKVVKDAESKAEQLVRDANEKSRALLEEGRSTALAMQEDARRQGKEAAAQAELELTQEGEGFLGKSFESAEVDIATLRQLASAKEEAAIAMIISEIV